MTRASIWWLKRIRITVNFNRQWTMALLFDSYELKRQESFFRWPLKCFIYNRLFRVKTNVIDLFIVLFSLLNNDDKQVFSFLVSLTSFRISSRISFLEPSSFSSSSTLWRSVGFQCWRRENDKSCPSWTKLHFNNGSWQRSHQHILS